MKTIQFTSIGGASGDMILGALIGLGANVDTINSELASLMPEEDYRIEVDDVEKHGITGIRAKVVIRHEHHHHRGLGKITSIIESSSLPENVKQMSVKVFTRLAEAEAKVHGTTPEKIHFHEVGAIDSIVDIVGCCLALNMLNVDNVSIGAIPVGCGTVECHHGLLPVPAPATVELLTGMEIIQTDEPFEMVTPTGAVLLSTWSSDNKPGGKLTASANSFGHREMNNRANLLRAVMYEADTKSTSSMESDSCTVLECNIDDCLPEIIGGVFDKLFDAGSLEVFSQSVLMKKQRQGILLTVICENSDCSKIEDIIFRETTTFGIRHYQVKRNKLSRRFDVVNTCLGDVKVKIGSKENEDITFSPEYADCIKVAGKNGVPVKEVYNTVVAAITDRK